ncbi:uncharacterized protein LOC122256365 [Penaeus japonicus]|uniref:uncharacterized protein LOC122256365 n=1 Tax=Penaeus japonicus TaxID=27405 RepID=UPI001C70D5B2|nr:uncharacterized protein LOC122256365 [Penaeus japonicus]
MKARLGLRIFLLICLLCSFVAQRIADDFSLMTKEMGFKDSGLKGSGIEEACNKGDFCANFFCIPVGADAREVVVWAGGGISVSVHGRIKLNIPANASTGYFSFLVEKRGSKYCVLSKSIPDMKFCDKFMNQLTFTSSHETTWVLLPFSKFSGCKYFLLLSFRMTLHETADALLWRPKDPGSSLRLGFRYSDGRYEEFIVFGTPEGKRRYDITFRRSSDGVSCVATSTSLDLSQTCFKDQRKADVIYVRSLSENEARTPSYFSLNCKNDDSDFKTPAEEGFSARSLSIPIDDEARSVLVWGGNGTGISALGPRNIILASSSDSGWFNLTAQRRDSDYCVTAYSFPKHIFCNKSVNQLSLASNLETLWDLLPFNISSGCKQYYLLSLHLALHDSPTKLLWRPGERGKSLYLGLQFPYGFHEFPVLIAAGSPFWYDIAFQRVSDGTSCVVTSTSLNVSSTCLKNQSEASEIYIRSLSEGGTRTPSYFSLNCQNDTGFSLADPVPTPESDSDLDWRVPAAAAFLLLLLIALPVVCLWRSRSSSSRETAQDDPVGSPPPPSLYPPHPPPLPPSAPPLSLIYPVDEGEDEDGRERMESEVVRFHLVEEWEEMNPIYNSFRNRLDSNSLSDSLDDLVEGSNSEGEKEEEQSEQEGCE